MIYLDYAANTPADSDVLERFVELEHTYIGNSNSQHPAGNLAQVKMLEITQHIADMLGVKPSDIIYTSGATEANNLAIKGIAEANAKYGKHILTTPMEHSSVTEPLDVLARAGYEIDLIDIDSTGKIILDDLNIKLRDDTILVAINHVDGETGVIQPIAEAKKIISRYPHCKLHVDGTQSVGKTDLCVEYADTWSCSAHKFYGLNGSGLLVKKQSVDMTPQMNGGRSTSKYRSGSPTLSLNGALEVALAKTMANFDNRIAKVREYSKILRENLAKYDKIQINTPEDGVPHIINLSIRDIKGSVMQRSLTEADVCVSVKSACSQMGAPSQAILAMYGNERRALSSWRISLSHLTTKEELDKFLEIFHTIFQTLYAKKTTK